MFIFFFSKFEFCDIKYTFPRKSRLIEFDHTKRSYVRQTSIYIPIMNIKNNTQTYSVWGILHEHTIHIHVYTLHLVFI